jgi:glycerate 2-kinase
LDALRQSAVTIVQAALRAADPARCLVRALQTTDLGNPRRIFVVGAGKASARMAQALEGILGDRVEAGWINTKPGHCVELQRIVCHESGHPVPDRAGVQGARAIAELAREATTGDLVICLISGGASALMPLPATGITLQEKQEVTRLLLGSGAPIEELNCVRKHLSAIKGGRLAELAAPARVISFILSDVVGDEMGVIGSGPTSPDPTTFADAREILERRGIWSRVPPSVQSRLWGNEEETPKPGDPLFDNVTNVIIGSNRLALDAAQSKARDLGFRTLLLTSSIQGEAREVARVHAAILKEVCATGDPIGRPACILSGGETTVTLRGGGKGGRNQEFGAFADGTTARRAGKAGFDPIRHLLENDSYPLFHSLGDLFITGPTRTNVMDIFILLAK